MISNLAALFCQIKAQMQWGATMSRKKACCKSGFPLKQETNRGCLSRTKKNKPSGFLSCGKSALLTLIPGVKSSFKDFPWTTYIGHLMAAKTRCKIMCAFVALCWVRCLYQSVACRSHCRPTTEQTRRHQSGNTKALTSVDHPSWVMCSPSF